MANAAGTRQSGTFSTGPAVWYPGQSLVTTLGPGDFGTALKIGPTLNGPLNPGAGHHLQPRTINLPSLHHDHRGIAVYYSQTSTDLMVVEIRLA